MENKRQSCLAIVFLSAYAFFLFGLPIIGIITHQYLIALIPVIVCLVCSVIMCIITIIYDVKHQSD